MTCRADTADPSDITRSSYAAPVRGDIIEWKVAPVGETESVPFEEGSAVLGTSARAALTATLARQDSGVRVEVVGRADPQGKPALGLARGLAIKRALIAAGMALNRVVLVPEVAGGIRPETSPGDSTVRWIPPTTHAGPVAAAPPAPASSLATPGVPMVPVAASEPLLWEVRTQDITLARTLERWASSAGYRLRWDADRNFLIAASDRYEGSFEHALQSVLASSGIRQSDYPLEACIYANRPPLVRITRMGEQARECEAP